MGAGEEETTAASCGINIRDYDINLRVGTLFAVLVAVIPAVFGPILWRQFFTRQKSDGIVMLIVKQFGTGVMISTALVHVRYRFLIKFTTFY